MCIIIYKFFYYFFDIEISEEVLLGYLDENENKKCLFTCSLQQSPLKQLSSIHDFQQGILLQQTFFRFYLRFCSSRF